MLGLKLEEVERELAVEEDRVVELRKEIVAKTRKANLDKLIDGIGNKLNENEPESVNAHIQWVLTIRDIMRKNKQFQFSDEIRDKLLEIGIVIEDSPTGAKWRSK